MPVPLENILYSARRFNASDIHLIAGLPPTWRVNGEIVIADAEPLSEDDLRNLMNEQLNEEQKTVLHKEMALCYSKNIEDLGRFRITIYFRNGSPEMAIRTCSDQILTRAELGLPVTIDQLLEKPSGLILVTGPTGSGKTTTLNYMIDSINSSRKCKIITIEDPIEYVHYHKKALVVQQELYTDVTSFNTGLIHILRQDPDVIGIGEMRNLDTIATALTAAETGHLVIATLHTSSVTQTVERIVDVFPPEQQPQVSLQLANSLQGIITQQLLPTIDKKSRALAYEMIVIDNAARHIIRENESYKLYSLLETGAKKGAVTMDSSLCALYEKGLISYDAMLSKAAHADSIRHKYNRLEV